jgi:hypothetical protein
MSPPERHRAAGPAGVPHRSAKAAASLVRLVSLKEQAQWLTTELSSSGLVALLSEDIDGAAQIAQDWLAELKAVLTALAIKLD